MATRNPTRIKTVSRPALIRVGPYSKGCGTTSKDIVASSGGLFCCPPEHLNPTRTAYFMSQEIQASSKQTKKCPKCHEDIQSVAKTCKHCGADLRNWFVRHKIITGLLMLFIIGVIASSSGNNESETPSNTPTASVSGDTTDQEAPAKAPEPSTIKITATELYSAYEANEIAADAAYKGNLLEVTGTLGSIAKDIFDNPYLALKTQNAFGSVHCQLKDSEQAKAADLKTGSRITVRGQGDGKMLNVIMKNCQIVQ